MNKVYTVKEFDVFTRDVNVEDSRYHALPKATFNQLEQFILTNKPDISTDADIMDFMSISSKRGIGKIIRIKNYVGIITLSDGTVIEILPKLYSKDRNDSKDETKRIFLDMLKFSLNLPYKTFKISDVHIEKNNILEIFIRMFIDQIYVLVKRGLKSAYIEHQDNEFFLKGKLNFSQHIKYNFAHQERFYIEYDIFNVNRPENKLIKSTLQFLRRVSSNRKNKKDISILLTSFDEIDLAINVEQEFSKVTLDRNIKEYKTILSWCSIFLRKTSFTTFSGQGVAYALLFPMEKIFESYIAGQLRKALDLDLYSMKTQDRSFHLYESPNRFLLKPDIVVYKDDRPVVVDTKWKILKNQPFQNYGISQADMYQSYAYHKKYDANTVILLYPWTPSFADLQEQIVYASHDQVTVRIAFVDLTDIKQSIHELYHLIDKYM